MNRKLSWQALTEHSKKTANLKIKEEFVNNPNRFTDFSLEAAGIFLDYSKNRITKETIALLCQLAKSCQVEQIRDQMFNGDAINVTENRAVLHTALRNPGDTPTAQMLLVKQELARITKYVNHIRSSNITDVVNIGIGGSDLGPAMVACALKPYSDKITTHFVSNIDATHISETIKYLNPKNTLFIIASKTFTTQETLTNALTAKEWLLTQIPHTNEMQIVKQHFIAVTAKPDKAIEFGIAAENVFPIWDWVGGRFSLWSAIGISVALTIGMDNFNQLLAGAHNMDEHFHHAPLEKNLPIILALIGIWNVNFLHAKTQAILPYDQYLSLFPAYLQQLEMESNGKRVDIDGKVIDYKTAPVIWGTVGTNGQHAFHQLLMQGTQLVPVDFIIPLNSHNPINKHHLLLYANCLAQSQALMCGQDNSEEPLCKQIPGNVPSNFISMDKITPTTVGALIAAYEHKVLVQGIIWRINSFDQWGVELGKKIANKLVPILEKETTNANLDGSTQGLISRYLSKNEWA